MAEWMRSCQQGDAFSALKDKEFRKNALPFRAQLF
jgi:hypothetical protein